MSRAARRASRTSASSRRTPVRPAGRTGLSVPWIPIVVVVAIGVVVALIAFLIFQSNKTSPLSSAEAQAIEADDDPSLPGEFVDLPTIYAGGYHSDTGVDTGSHQRQSIDYTKQGLPPAGGPHWGNSTCPEHLADAQPFCGPVQWGIYRTPDNWSAGSLVHNMEHGGVIVWYNTSDAQFRDELESVVKPHVTDDDQLVVMVPYDQIPEDTVAMTAWGRRETFPKSEYTKERVDTFINKLERRFNPEKF